MIAKLERVQLREAFPREVRDLSKWVQANLDELNAATGLSLSSAETEQPAGDFSVDLIAEDENGDKIVIENQYGSSDHGHLGKVLTYLTAHEAKAAIWIVERPRVEHVNAVAWLNQSSSAEFYLLKIEAVKIGNSDVAPLFTMIVGPSAEAKRIAGEKEKFQARHSERLEFWRGLLEVANSKSDLHAGRSPTKDGSIGGPSGIPGIRYVYVIHEHAARIELYISLGSGRGDDNLKIFNTLFSKKGEIEAKFGNQLDWQSLEHADACRIAITAETGGYRDPDKWPQTYEWMTKNMAALYAAFQPHIESLDYQ